MSWSEVQRGKQIVKQIVAEIDKTLACDIPEPVGEDFDHDRYPVMLRGRGKPIRLKIDMEDLEDIVADKNVRRRVQRWLEANIPKKVA